MKSFVKKRFITDSLRKELDAVTGDPAFADQLQMGLPCISLISHPSLNTAFMNDCNSNMIFAQQLFVLGNEGDTLLGISTSGNSENVCNALKTAKAKKIKTVLLTGANHGICEKFADVSIHVPAKETYKIQEYHLPVYHTLCLMLEECFYGNR